MKWFRLGKLAKLSLQEGIQTPMRCILKAAKHYAITPLRHYGGNGVMACLGHWVNVEKMSTNVD